MANENIINRKLLIVEDDDEVRDAILNSIIDANAEIITANNGVEGIEAVVKHHPTAIMTDINMPKMTGLEMIKEIRTLGLESPIIVLSAFGDRANTIEALRLGVYDFVNKPFEIDDLNRVIQAGLELGQKLVEFEKMWAEHIEKYPDLKTIEKMILEHEKELLKLRFMSHPKRAY